MQIGATVTDIQKVEALAEQRFLVNVLEGQDELHIDLESIGDDDTDLEHFEGWVWKTITDQLCMFNDYLC